MSGITHRSFVSYIDRTRDVYAAQGYEKPYVWSRHTSAPFAPRAKPLSASRLTVITTASPWREEKPVEGVLRGGKQVWSGPTATPPERLFTDDLALGQAGDPHPRRESFLPELVQQELEQLESRSPVARGELDLSEVKRELSLPG